MIAAVNRWWVRLGVGLHRWIPENLLNLLAVGEDGPVGKEDLCSALQGFRTTLASLRVGPPLLYGLSHLERVRTRFDE